MWEVNGSQKTPRTGITRMLKANGQPSACWQQYRQTGNNRDPLCGHCRRTWHVISRSTFRVLLLVAVLLLPRLASAQELAARMSTGATTTAEKAMTEERIPGEPDRRPNIVLIMADDMGFSDIGCYGGEVETPVLNRLAEQGLRMTQFYNNAKCTTTRASLITGLYPRPRQGLLDESMVTLGEVLGEAGYHTSLSGKWHLGHDEGRHPFKRGFDRFYGLLDGCCNFFDPSQRDPDFKGGRVRVFGQDDQRITEFPDDFYTTDAFTDHAVESIQDFAKDDRPFFVHVCYTAPHYPLHAKPEDIAKYRGRYRMGWDELRRQRYARQIEMGLVDESTWKLAESDPRAYEWDSANQDWEDLRMATYAAMIDSMDQNIGRIVEALEETGQLDNTLILFLSDNGGCAEEPGGRNDERVPGPKEFYTAVGPSWGWAQNAPFRKYKSWVHEGGITTPLIAHWPERIKPNTMSHQPAHLIDLMPTFLELAESEYPTEFNGTAILPSEGLSMTEILEGGEREPHQVLCWEWSGNRAVRIGDWKLVWDKQVKEWELYDLSKDRTETNDLAKQKPEIATQMSHVWVQWALRTGVISR